MEVALECFDKTCAPNELTAQSGVAGTTWIICSLNFLRSALLLFGDFLYSAVFISIMLHTCAQNKSTPETQEEASHFRMPGESDSDVFCRLLTDNLHRLLLNIEGTCVGKRRWVWRVHVDDV